MPLQPNFIERRLIRRGTIPGILLDASMAAFTTQAIVAAMELDLFEHVRNGPVTVETLAERTDASTHGLAVLLRALVPLSYLERDGDEYRLSTAAKRSLPQEEVPAMGTFLKIQARKGLDSTRAVSEAPEDGVIGWETVQSGDVGRGYQAMMRWLAVDLVDEIVETVSLPDGAERLLDVGGSHGLYTVGFCEEQDGLLGTILDWPIGIEAAERTLEEHPELADRIDLVERDFQREELPEGYDFAFLGQIVHGLTAAGNRQLFDKLDRATTEIGTVAILDQVSDPPSTGLLPFDPMQSSFADGIAALLGFGLFVFTGGRTHAYRDLQSWLSAAGFTDVTYSPVKQSPGFSLIVARKPGVA